MVKKKNDYDKLEEEFDKKVELLQEHTCKHEKTKWMEEWWAIGHSTGYNVLVCLNCNKKIEKKAASLRRKEEEAMKAAKCDGTRTYGPSTKKQR